MSDLRERLNRLQSGNGPAHGRGREELISDLRSRIDRVIQKEPEAPCRAPTGYAGPGIESLVPGEIVSSERGDVFVARQEYETGYLHGNRRLEEIFQQSLEAFGEVSGDQALAGMDPNRTVFMDTETTGLAGGTGTYAFEIGVGFFDKERFVLEQFLMRDHAEEAAMLGLLRDRLAAFDYLVSFNGKSFDLPLLESRFIMARLDPAVLAVPHLDLLHPARRIWKRSLESCRLSHLESELLGIERSDDVPGELIPGIYFHYLQTGDASRMERVFYHNRLDILSLVTLTVLIGRLISDHTASARRDGLEQYSLGRMHLARGNLDQAEGCLEAALESCAYSEAEWEILKHLSLVHKKKGAMKEAARAWEDMIGMDPEREIFPYLELAKYYEHQARDYARAETYAREAARMNQTLCAVDPKEMEHRIHRLRTKQEKEI